MAFNSLNAGKYAIWNHPDLTQLRIEEGHGLGPNGGVKVLQFDLPNGDTCELRLDPNIPKSKLTLQQPQRADGVPVKPFCIS